MPEQTSLRSAVASQGLVASAGAAARWIRSASLPIDRLTCWLDRVQVMATRVRVIAIRDPTLRMRVLLTDYRIVQLRADLSFVKKDLASGRVTGLY